MEYIREILFETTMIKYFISHIWDNNSTHSADDNRPMKQAVWAIMKALGWEEDATQSQNKTPELVLLISLAKYPRRLPLPDAQLFLNLLPDEG